MTYFWVDALRVICICLLPVSEITCQFQQCKMKRILKHQNDKKCIQPYLCIAILSINVFETELEIVIHSYTAHIIGSLLSRNTFSHFILSWQGVYALKLSCTKVRISGRGLLYCTQRIYNTLLFRWHFTTKKIDFFCVALASVRFWIELIWKLDFGHVECTTLLVSSIKRLKKKLRYFHQKQKDKQQNSKNTVSPSLG